MNRHEIDGLVNRADRYYEDGDFDRAIDFYVCALEMDTKNLDALKGLGQAYEAQLNWQHSVSVYEQLLAIAPEDPMAHYLMGHSLGALGEYDRALDELHCAENLGYFAAELHSAIGYACHMKGDIEQAIESYRLALNLDPDDTITMFNYGKALVAQRSYVAARKILENAVEVDPEDAQSWIALGEVYEDLDDLDQAFHAYERALDLDPSSPDARCLAAHVCLMMGRYDEAEWEYKQVVGENPDEGEAWAGLGEVLIAQERYHEALAACKKAIEIDEFSVFGLSGYVSACEHIGSFDDARRAISTALDKEPDNPDLWYLLGGIEASAALPENALLAYERAAKLNPNDAAAHAGVGWSLIELGNDLETAMVHLLQSVRLAPDWYYPCLQLGELFLLKNDRKLAAEWFIRAIEIAPDEPEVREAFADPEIQSLINNPN